MFMDKNARRWLGIIFGGIIGLIHSIVFFEGLWQVVVTVDVLFKVLTHLTQRRI